MKVKRLLIITYYWPPQGGSGVQRWLKFVKYLREFGWEPTVYTPLNPEMMSSDSSLLEEIPEGVTILKRPIREPYALYRWFTGKGDESVKPGFITEERDSFKERLSLSIRSNLFIPDPKCFWIGPSVRFLKKHLREERVDAIVSTGPPHSMHLIAERVAKSTSIPWVADFRDPWTTIFTFKNMGYNALVKRIHRGLEREVLKSADRVITVSNSIAEELYQIKRGDEGGSAEGSKIGVITNGYDHTDFPEKEIELEESFTITYSGLFMESQNPSQLWRWLGERVASDSKFATQLKIRIIGHCDGSIVEDINSNGLEQNLELMGYLPHSEVVEWQRRAALLLLATTKEPEAKGIITGKLFEYLASGRPILAFGPKGGDSDYILSESERGEMFEYDQYEGVGEWVEREYHRYLNRAREADGFEQERALSEERALPPIEKYSRRELTRELTALLDRLIDGE